MNRDHTTTPIAIANISFVLLPGVTVQDITNEDKMLISTASVSNGSRITFLYTGAMNQEEFIGFMRDSVACIKECSDYQIRTPAVTTWLQTQGSWHCDMNDFTFPTELPQDAQLLGSTFVRIIKSFMEEFCPERFGWFPITSCADALFESMGLTDFGLSACDSDQILRQLFVDGRISINPFIMVWFFITFQSPFVELLNKHEDWTDVLCEAGRWISGCFQHPGYVDSDRTRNPECFPHFCPSSHAEAFKELFSNLYERMQRSLTMVVLHYDPASRTPTRASPFKWIEVDILDLLLPGVEINGKTTDQVNEMLRAKAAAITARNQGFVFEPTGIPRSPCPQSEMHNTSPSTLALAKNLRALSVVPETHLWSPTENAISQSEPQEDGRIRTHDGELTFATVTAPTPSSEQESSAPAPAPAPPPTPIPSPSAPESPPSTVPSLLVPTPPTSAATLLTLAPALVPHVPIHAPAQTVFTPALAPKLIILPSAPIHAPAPATFASTALPLLVPQTPAPAAMSSAIARDTEQHPGIDRPNMVALGASVPTLPPTPSTSLPVPAPYVPTLAVTPPAPTQTASPVPTAPTLLPPVLPAAVPWIVAKNDDEQPGVDRFNTVLGASVELQTWLRALLTLHPRAHFVEAVRCRIDPCPTTILVYKKIKDEKLKLDGIPKGYHAVQLAAKQTKYGCSLAKGTETAATNAHQDESDKLNLGLEYPGAH